MIPILCSIPKSTTPYLHMLDNQCSTMKDLNKIHAHLIKTGLIHQTTVASRVLAFSVTADINYAYWVFQKTTKKNIFIWNTIIRGFSQSSNPLQAIFIFIQMLVLSSVQPQRLTYPSVFKAYAQLGLAHDGAQLHGRVVKQGLQFDPFIRNTLLYMYLNCGCLSEACRVFGNDVEFDVVSWNSMIMGLAKCGEIEESRKLFDEMPDRNTVSWNSMISGYVRNHKLFEALELFREMQENDIRTSEFTMVSLLNACASLGASREGKWIHEYMIKNNFEFNGIVVTAIIDMYCKCGFIEQALKIFKEAPKKQLSCWNSMILGLAYNGNVEEAIDLFSDLQSSNLEPDSVSFIGVLTACSHTGMVGKAKEYFSLMMETYKIKPSIKHYNCMVEVLGGAGLLEEAEMVIRSMSVKADAVIWGSLLSACRKHGNVEMATCAAEHVMELDPYDSSGYILMSNVYAASNQYGKAINQRGLMKKMQIEKEPGCSLIEVDGEIFEFVTAGGNMNPKATEIYMLLDEIHLQ